MSGSAIKNKTATQPQAPTVDPLPNASVADKGSSLEMARNDHVHEYSSGSVIQVQNDSSETTDATTLTAWQTYASVAPSITVKKTGSKILILANINIRSNADDGKFSFRREVGGVNTDNIVGTTYGVGRCDQVSGNHNLRHFSYYDNHGESEGTTITYKLNFAAVSGGEINIGTAGVLNSITLMEIMP